MHHFRIATVVLPLIVSTFIGCSKKEIVIGGLASITGPDAASGVSSQHGFDLAFAECNATGGINGRPVKLVIADNQSDDLACTIATQHLVNQEKVVAVLGPNWSTLALSGGRICQQAKVPLLATTATGSAVTQIGDYIFRACYTDKQEGEVGAKFAFESLKARNAACLFIKYFVQTPHQSAAENFSAKFSSLGGKAVTDDFGMNGKDSNHVLDNLLAAKPDLLYVAAPGDEAARVAKQAREKGFKGPILGMDDWDMPQLIEQGGSAVEGSFFTNHFSTGDPRPEVQGFVKKYHDRFGVDPDVLAVMAYDSSRLLFDSIRRAGSTEGSAVRDALKAADFPAITGRVKFDESRNPVKPVVIIQVQAGKLAYNSTMNP